MGAFELNISQSGFQGTQSLVRKQTAVTHCDKCHTESPFHCRGRMAIGTSGVSAGMAFWLEAEECLRDIPQAGRRGGAL